jgi:DNA replication protein DnaC
MTEEYTLLDHNKFYNSNYLKTCGFAKAKFLAENKNSTIYEWSHSISKKFSKKYFNELIDELKENYELNPAAVEKNKTATAIEFSNSQNSMFLEIKFHKSEFESTITLNGLFSAEELLDSVNEIFEKFYSRIFTTEKTVYCVAQQQGNYYLRRLKDFDEHIFIENNYTNETMMQLNNVIKNLSNPQPPGRIVILEGPPGTGKTHLIKGILSKISDAILILLPTQYSDFITGPSFITTMLNSFETRKNKSIVFVLEDAESSLVKRDTMNYSQISTFLNIGDGIIGDALDIKLIATTNVNKMDIDEAILRPGRLLERIEVNPLEEEKALEVTARLVKEKELKSDPESILRKISKAKGKKSIGFGSRNDGETYSLAEIYRAINEEFKQ